MEETYDIIIVGCGMAGALAGLAALQEDLTVCIVERKQREFIGKKTCGELIPQKICEWLKNDFALAIEYYPLKGLTICSKYETIHAEGALHIEEPLCTIDRWKFGQILVDELLKRGVHLKHETVRGLVYGTCLKGVKTEDSVLHGAVTIDCSGVFSVLRKKVMKDSRAVQSFGIAYKENITMRESHALESAVLMFDTSVVPSGYIWYFPKSEYTLNAGVGGLVQGKGLREILANVVEAHFSIEKRTHAGFGILPLGMPLPSVVGPGLLVCGDAACHVNPLTGEGIAPALMGGYSAGKVAARAVQNSDTSVRGMWQYNSECARRYGAIFGPLFVLRDFLLSLSQKELTFLLDRLITSEELAQLEKHWSSPSLKRMLTVFLTNWRNLPLLYKLNTVLKRMMEIRNHYECYPEGPEGFLQWRQDLASLFQ